MGDDTEIKLAHRCSTNCAVSDVCGRIKQFGLIDGQGSSCLHTWLFHPSPFLTSSPLWIFHSYMFSVTCEMLPRRWTSQRSKEETQLNKQLKQMWKELKAIWCDTIIYSVSQKNPDWGFLTFFQKRLGIFSPNFICLLHIPIYARVQIFILLPATLTRLCHIKRDHLVHIICPKCPPLTETHVGWSHLIWHNFITVWRNWITICSLA